jgi:hypothetical protein
MSVSERLILKLLNKFIKLSRRKKGALIFLTGTYSLLFFYLLSYIYLTYKNESWMGGFVMITFLAVTCIGLIQNFKKDLPGMFDDFLAFFSIPTSLVIIATLAITVPRAEIRNKLLLLGDKIIQPVNSCLVCSKLKTFQQLLEIEQKEPSQDEDKNLVRQLANIFNKAIYDKKNARVADNKLHVFFMEIQKIDPLFRSKIGYHDLLLNLPSIKSRLAKITSLDIKELLNDKIYISAQKSISDNLEFEFLKANDFIEQSELASIDMKNIDIVINPKISDISLIKNNTAYRVQIELSISSIGRTQNFTIIWQPQFAAESSNNMLYLERPVNSRDKSSEDLFKKSLQMDAEAINSIVSVITVYESFTEQQVEKYSKGIMEGALIRDWFESISEGQYLYHREYDKNRMISLILKSGAMK